jgi:hypothetical protein
MRLMRRTPPPMFGDPGYHADQAGQALTWLRECPHRWLLASDRWLTPCCDTAQAVYAGHDRDRTLFLVDARVVAGRCAAQPAHRLFRFQWERPYGWPARPEGGVQPPSVAIPGPNGFQPTASSPRPWKI